MKKLLFILYLFSFISVAQNQQKLDSLKFIVRTTTNDTTKIEALKNLFKQTVFQNKDSALVYQKEMLSYSESKNFDYGMYHAYFYQSYYNYLTGKMDDELHYMKLASTYAEKMENHRFQVDVFLRINSVFNRKGAQDSSLFYLNKALKIAEDNAFNDQVAFCSLELGNSLTAKREFDKALQAYQKCIEVLTDIDPKHRAIGVANGNIALIYYDLGDYKKAKAYNLETEKLYVEVNDIRGLMGIKSRLGEIEMKLKNYPEAKIKLQEAYAYYKKVGDNFRLAETGNYLAEVIEVLEGKDKALPFYVEGLKLRESINDSIGISSSNQYLGEYYLAKNDFEKSKAYFLKTLDFSKRLNRLDQQKTAYYFLSVISQKQNDYKKAHQYLSDFNTINDSITKLNNVRNLQELEAKYQNEKKDQEITLLQSQKLITEQQKINQRNLLLGGLAITTLVGLFFFFMFRNRQKTNKKLRELNAAKLNFFANVSHEFRTPLTLIKSPVEEELNKEDLSKPLRKKFQLIRRNSNRLLSLVDQLLMFSKAEGNVLRLFVQDVHIQTIIAAIVSAFEYGFKQKEIDFKTDLKATGSGYLDVDFVEKILTNLLSNALKYTSEKGTVTFSSNIKNNKLNIEISNSGNYLSPEEIKRIFNKFYQTNTKNDGFGIGLSLVKELVDIHKGHIEVKNKNGKIIFHVSLPISKSFYSSEEISEDHFYEEAYNISPIHDLDEESIAEIDLNTSNKPLLLLVEDHKDMRNYTKNLFIDTYDIIEAKNGEVGIEYALEHIPDIIISDVMMPKVDGIELVKTLKKDERTSHIPIVLLTAKAEEKDLIKGTLTGADDYITKPFNPKFLHAKIDTLFNNLEKIRERYSHEVQLKPAILSVNSTEESFFNKLQNIIDEKLQNPDFNVDSFSSTIGMSRMQLHRKLKATLGISASEFLRTERLKAARHLLQTSDLSISEIAYSTGFNDANYFSKSFKKLFQIAPSDFKDLSSK